MSACLEALLASYMSICCQWAAVDKAVYSVFRLCSYIAHIILNDAGLVTELGQYHWLTERGKSEVYVADYHTYAQLIHSMCVKLLLCNSRTGLFRVPFAKPGKESMDVEVFGMAGVPDGAVPGAPPPEGE